MNQTGVHLLDLPDEILIIIFKKLDNMDILYSFFGIPNQRINALMEDEAFLNALNFAKISSNIVLKHDRFCNSILPQKHHHIKKLVLDSNFMERILRIGDYPKLTSLELFNFGQETAVHYLRDNSVYRNILKKQITSLVLHNNDEYTDGMLLRTYFANVYEHIMVLFENLQHLIIVPSSVDDYPPLSFSIVQSTTNFSSTLTVLDICVSLFDDCLCLLDGHLHQLTTFIVQVTYIGSSFIKHHLDELKNLKYFSLTCYHVTFYYDQLVLPLLRRMKHLQRLTLYLRIGSRNIFIDGKDLQNEILVFMPQLNEFIFYISTECTINSTHPKSVDIQRTLSNIRYTQASCIIDCCGTSKAVCRIYSLPFRFPRLTKITNNFPNLAFESVTHLHAYDVVSMEHQFFLRISEALPSLKCFWLENEEEQKHIGISFEPCMVSSYTIIKYPHLISLHIPNVHIDYVGQFLLQAKTHLPRLTELTVDSNHLKTVTMNFRRDASRRNCLNIQRLNLEGSMEFSINFHEYFPLLQINAR